MSKRWQLPIDENGETAQFTPRATALARSVLSTLSSTVETTLETDTTILRLYAISQDVYLRWGIEDCNANTFDEIIPAGQVIDVEVPNQKDGTLFTAFNVIERVSGATLIIIQK